MSVCVIGLGKLGYPMAEFLSTSGESISCYDKNQELLVELSNGNNPLKFEKYISEFISNSNPLKYFFNVDEALKNSELCFVTVPTPSKDDGSFSNSFLIKVFDDLSNYLQSFKKYSKNPYIIVINSTISPGSIDKKLIPHLEKKGFVNNNDFCIIYNPYFVALGDVLNGLKHPDMVLIGCQNEYAKKKILKLYKKIYQMDVNFRIMNFKEAELTKLLVNSYLTLKISFSNLVRNISLDDQISSKVILDAIGTDSRIGQKYMKPGGPFSGPCLPRDNQALVKYCKDNSTPNYLSVGALETNNFTIEQLKNQILKLKELGEKSISFAGIGYKSNTHSMEESFIIPLMEYSHLIGLDVYYFDKYVTEDEVNLDFANRVSVLKNLSAKSNIVFLPYVDNIFNELLNTDIIIWDIWYKITSIKTVRSINEFEKKRHLEKPEKIVNLKP